MNERSKAGLCPSAQPSLGRRSPTRARLARERPGLRSSPTFAVQSSQGHIKSGCDRPRPPLPNERHSVRRLVTSACVSCAVLCSRERVIDRRPRCRFRASSPERSIVYQRSVRPPPVSLSPPHDYLHPLPRSATLLSSLFPSAELGSSLWALTGECISRELGWTSARANYKLAIPSATARVPRAPLLRAFSAGAATNKKTGLVTSCCGGTAGE